MNDDTRPWMTIQADGEVGVCNRCFRSTWSVDELGTIDTMPQPSGHPCGGTFTSDLSIRPRYRQRLEE